MCPCYAATSIIMELMLINIVSCFPKIPYDLSESWGKNGLIKSRY